MNEEFNENEEEGELGSTPKKLKRTTLQLKKITLSWVVILRSAAIIFTVPIIGFFAGLLHLNYLLFRHGKNLSGSQKSFIIGVNAAALVVPVLFVVILLIFMCEIPGSGFFDGGTCDILDIQESPVKFVVPSAPSSGGRTVSPAKEIAGEKCEPCEKGFATPKSLSDTIASNPVLQANCGAGFDPVIASRVASAESTCNSYRRTSQTCIADGAEFAVGLFQINMSVHEIYDAEGKAFRKTNPDPADGKEYRCQDVFTSPVLDSNYTCSIKKGEFFSTFYEECKTLLRQDTLANLVNACKVQKQQGWGAWGAYLSYQDCRDPSI